MLSLTKRKTRSSPIREKNKNNKYESIKKNLDSRVDNAIITFVEIVKTDKAENIHVSETVVIMQQNITSNIHKWPRMIFFFKKKKKSFHTDKRMKILVPKISIIIIGNFGGKVKQLPVENLGSQKLISIQLQYHGCGKFWAKFAGPSSGFFYPARDFS